MGKIVRRYYLRFKNVVAVKRELGIKLSDAVKIAKFIFEQRESEFIDELKRHYIEFSTSDDKVAETVSLSDSLVAYVDAIADSYCYSIKSCVVDFMLKKLIELYHAGDDEVRYYVVSARVIRNTKV